MTAINNEAIMEYLCTKNNKVNIIKQNYRRKMSIRKLLVGGNNLFL